MTKQLRLAAIACAVISLTAFQMGHAQTATAPVQVTGGAIVGADDGTLRTYFGVPFAAPPVGNLRWRAPQPVVPWQGAKVTREYSPACSQTATWITNPKSEDCLYLNIWAPRDAKKLPVIVWIHGGAMESGTAAVPVQNGANLAKRGAIVVTLNYRLGIFGFYSSPELSAESPEHVSGNQGILDQIAALHWIQRNISAFGGDPSRVTIMGSSSGGESVALLVASPLAKGLFQRAIAESGNDAMPISPEDDHRFDERGAAEAKGVAFAKSVGAKKLADLRKLSAEQLQKQEWDAHVYIDRHVLSSDLTTIYRNHRENDVPLLVGWTAEEGKDLVGFYLDPGKSTAKGRAGQMAKLLGYYPSDGLLRAYPGGSDSEAAASIEQLTNDWWGWRMVHWADLQAKYGRSKAYVYYFAHRPAPPATPCNWGCGAGHGVEVQYMLDNLDVDPRTWSPDDRQLADRMADTVIQFARTGRPTGNPGQNGFRAWPEFDGSTASILTIGNAAELKEHPIPDFSVFSRLANGS